MPYAPGHVGMNPEPRPLSRPIAIGLTVLALASGIAGLFMLPPDGWGVGLILFGCLLALIGLLAQGAEHFVRMSMRRPQ